MVCPMLPTSMWNAEGFAQAAEKYNRIGAKAQSLGLKFAFHNHNYEFRPISRPGQPDTSGLSILLERTDPKLVFWEEDCYWVTQSGNSALVLLKQHADRVRLLHIKDRRSQAKASFDMSKDSEFFTEVGTGTIEWPPILKIARDNGLLLFIEQDQTTLPPLAVPGDSATAPSASILRSKRHTITKVMTMMRGRKVIGSRPCLLVPCPGSRAWGHNRTKPVVRPSHHGNRAPCRARRES